MSEVVAAADQAAAADAAPPAEEVCARASRALSLARARARGSRAPGFPVTPFLSPSPRQPKVSEHEVIERYKQMRRECQQLATKVSELELESNEHQLVIDTLTPIEPERRAFHLVNGVLIQKSAGVVLPEVASRKASIEALIEQLKGFLATKEKDSKEWKEKYNIRTQQEHEAMQKAREAEAKKAGRAAGDGASPSGLLA